VPGAARLARYANNRPLANFHCETCRAEFELKSKKGRFGPKVADGAYGAKLARLASDTNPNLVLMNYDLARFGVTDLFFVPKHFFVREIIEERPPLAPTARRVGWIGSNILLREVPASGKVWFVREGEIADRAQVLEQWRSPALRLRSGRSSRKRQIVGVFMPPGSARRPLLTPARPEPGGARLADRGDEVRRPARPRRVHTR
jgi:type II restriction enzyme